MQVSKVGAEHEAGGKLQAAHGTHLVAPRDSTNEHHGHHNNPCPDWGRGGGGGVVARGALRFWTTYKLSARNGLHPSTAQPTFALSSCSVTRFRQWAIGFAMLTTPKATKRLSLRQNTTPQGGQCTDFSAVRPLGFTLTCCGFFELLAPPLP